jgi:aldehyde:ferredoxin oxidoreductase
MMNGYSGKILRLNLSGRTQDTIPTQKYLEWVGGHGMGTAIFFDLVGNKIREMQDGFHEANVITMMTSPLTGTLVPACAGRLEVQGVGVQSHPIGWFTRSNFGGRFSTMLKHAGWDGIVIEGSATEPIWIDIRDDLVRYRKCDELSLWGQDAWETQETIWKDVAGRNNFREWYEPTGQSGQTTQRSAVVAIGPAGENVCRTACLIHDASNASGQGGFGAIWGLKKLKAISVIGTGGVDVHDPRELLKARLWLKDNYAFKLGDLKSTELTLSVGGAPVPAVLFGNVADKAPGQSWFDRPDEPQRPQACVGCHAGCRARYESGVGNEAGCMETMLCPDAESMDVQRQATDLLNRFGLNAWEMVYTLNYIRFLNKEKILGPGLKIDSPLDFSDYGTFPFVKRFLEMAATKQAEGQTNHPFAVALSEGAFRAAEAWGRLETDLKSGDLPYAHWGIPMHFDPRMELEWGYGTILGDRDVNEHDFQNVWAAATQADWMGREPDVSAEQAVDIILPKLVPFNDDPRILDYGDDNMYSEHIAKLVAWHRYYTRFWKVTVQFCDWRWPDFVNINVDNRVGCTGVAEPLFLKAVTGRDLGFEESIQLGRRIWNLNHVIWTLQGRHRDQVHFADYIYEKDVEALNGTKNLLPVLKDDRWSYQDCFNRKLDKDRVDDFKSAYYRLEGWDEATGYPTRQTLEDLQLPEAADMLSRYELLG